WASCRPIATWTWPCCVRRSVAGTSPSPTSHGAMPPRSSICTPSTPSSPPTPPTFRATASTPARPATAASPSSSTAPLRRNHLVDPTQRIGHDFDRRHVAHGDHHCLPRLLGRCAGGERATAVRLEPAFLATHRERPEQDQLARPLIQRPTFSGRRLQ